MSFAAFAGIVGLMLVLELPDKSMVANIVMATRARPLMVFIGASSAFIVQMAIAALAGSLLLRLPHTPRAIVTTVLFFAGAAYLLLVPEKHEEQEGGREGAAERASSRCREILTAFTVIFLGEFGDLTQIQAANLVARTHLALAVFAACSIALIIAAALASFFGQIITSHVPIRRIRVAGGLVFTGLGVWGVATLAGA
jgi:putative Ca2+/H+ antiporter (TMEM165/GDT1 family)